MPRRCPSTARHLRTAPGEQCEFFFSKVATLFTTKWSFYSHRVPGGFCSTPNPLKRSPNSDSPTCLLFLHDSCVQKRIWFYLGMWTAGHEELKKQTKLQKHGTGQREEVGPKDRVLSGCGRPRSRRRKAGKQFQHGRGFH